MPANETHHAGGAAADFGCGRESGINISGCSSLPPPLFMWYWDEERVPPPPADSGIITGADMDTETETDDGAAAAAARGEAGGETGGEAAAAEDGLPSGCAPGLSDCCCCPFITDALSCTQATQHGRSGVKQPPASQKRAERARTGCRCGRRSFACP